MLPPSGQSGSDSHYSYRYNMVGWIPEPKYSYSELDVESVLVTMSQISSCPRKVRH